MKGIDVSKHNCVIDRNTVKQSGEVDFAIMRTGYKQENENFDENLY